MPSKFWGTETLKHLSVDCCNGIERILQEDHSDIREPRDDLVRTELGDSCQHNRFHERTISERNFPDGRDSAADGESLKIRAIFLRSMSPVIGIFMGRQQSEHALNTTS